MRTKRRNINRLESNGHHRDRAAAIQRDQQPELDGWCRDLRVEGMLDKLEVAWELRVVDIGDIDREYSLKQSGRPIVPLSQDTVERYADAMQAGARFPAFIVADRGHGLFAVGGNHRVHAAVRAGRRQALAYHLTTQDTMMQDIVSRIDNGGNGLQLNREEAALAAIELMDRYSFTMKQAAEAAFSTVSAVSQFIKAREVREWLTGEVSVARLSTRQCEALHSLLSVNKPAGRELSRLAIRYNLGGEHIAEATRDIRRAKTEDGMLDRVAALDKSLAKTYHRKVATQTPRRTAARGAVSRCLSAISGATTLAELQFTEPADVEQFVGDLKKLKRAIDALVP